MALVFCSKDMFYWGSGQFTDVLTDSNGMPDYDDTWWLFEDGMRLEDLSKLSGLFKTLQECKRNNFFGEIPQAYSDRRYRKLNPPLDIFIQNKYPHWNQGLYWLEIWRDDPKTNFGDNYGR